MADHRTSAERRTALTTHVRSLLDSGELSPGEPLPPLRKLSERFGLSAPTILKELGPLIVAGRLVSVPRVGIFVGRERVSGDSRFLFLHPPLRTPLERQHASAIRIGFEATIADLGGSSVPLTFDDRDQLDDLPALATYFSGVAAWTAARTISHLGLGDLELPRVLIGAHREDSRETYDAVHFDDIGGGRLAVEHLLAHGHTAIAYLGLHAGEPLGPDPAHGYSLNRRDGWRMALVQARLDPNGLDFELERPVSHYPTARDAARVAAGAMISQRDRFTAVVGADDHAILGIVDAYAEHRVPYAEWPALVGFEGTFEAEGFVSNSILPQWHQLGQHAAQLLWDRHHGILTGPAVDRYAGMKVMARMTSAHAWPTTVPANLGNILLTDSPP